MTALDPAAWPSPYAGYLYAYPHKTAYRPLRPRPALAQVWADQPRDAVFGYLHVPFCEMRCGFCNLFTRALPDADLVERYLDQVEVQTRVLGEAIGPVSLGGLAIGGGTPTYLSAEQLARMTALLAAAFPDRRGGYSVETSPATATPERLAVLAAAGASRISIGVQSFVAGEAQAAGRPQRPADVESALAALAGSGIPVRNVDLIYGIPGQTPASWLASLDRAVTAGFEEIYCYPLYVRPLTGLARRLTPPTAPDPDWDAQRLALYRLAVQRLNAAGYLQDSMRMFRRPGHAAQSLPDDYSCQDDPMIGIGCGARSYTSRLHYSFDYAVGVSGVRAIIETYLSRSATDLGYAEVGYRISPAEQRRRWLITSLLKAAGFRRVDYAQRFGRDLTQDVDLTPLSRAGLIEDDGWIRLTPNGLAWSDAVGSWLVSPQVRASMQEYAAR